TATPAPALLSPTDHALVLIDFQSQMAFATHTIDISALRNNVSLIGKGKGGQDLRKTDVAQGLGDHVVDQPPAAARAALGCHAALVVVVAA
ncbi:hypothetical protein ABGA94_03180, partial [Stenotrophomonas sp. 3diitr2024]